MKPCYLSVSYGTNITVWVFELKYKNIHNSCYSQNHMSVTVCVFWSDSVSLSPVCPPLLLCSAPSVCLSVSLSHTHTHTSFQVYNSDQYTYPYCAGAFCLQRLVQYSSKVIDCFLAKPSSPQSTAIRERGNSCCNDFHRNGE